MQASDYFRQFDEGTVVTKLSQLKEKITAIRTYARRRHLRLFWRGQSDHTWGLTSSLVRILSKIRTPTDELVNRVEDALLEQAGAWIADLRRQKFRRPLARLAYMQHHGIPTRLIDFTSNPWIAVYFAVQPPDNVDGRLFALLVDDASILSATPLGTPWREYGTDEVRVWDSVASGASFPRIKAQKGVFALGRLPSTQPHRQGYDDVLKGNRSLLAEEVRRILSVPFKINRSDPLPDQAVVPIGFTFRIHIDKESSRLDLQALRQGMRVSSPERPISHSELFPDADGFVGFSRTMLELQRGVIIPADLEG